jgi:hypothetical protein
MAMVTLKYSIQRAMILVGVPRIGIWDTYPGWNTIKCDRAPNLSYSQPWLPWRARNTKFQRAAGAAKWPPRARWGTSSCVSRHGAISTRWAGDGCCYGQGSNAHENSSAPVSLRRRRPNFIFQIFWLFWDFSVCHPKISPRPEQARGVYIIKAFEKKKQFNAQWSLWVVPALAVQI